MSVRAAALREANGDALAPALSGKKRPPPRLVNVAQVRHLSPFRYPGGKTWLVPEIRRWLETRRAVSVFVEPFAGGAMAGLSVAAEQLAGRVALCELDMDVAAVWGVIFNGADKDVRWLCRQIRTFDVSLESVRAILDENHTACKQRAFRTIIKNRMQRGGIMSAGAGLVKHGEAGRGLMSRWYPVTLEARIEELRRLRARVEFTQGDAFAVIERFASDADAVFFIDPPYTAGGKNAGRRLYTHSEVDHDALFRAVASVSGSALLTYDDSPEVRALARRHRFSVETVPMKNTHHEVMRELLIWKP